VRRAGARGEKIARHPACVLRGSGRPSVRKAIRAGALFGGRLPGRECLTPLGFRDDLVARPFRRKNERGGSGRDAPGRAFAEGAPERSERPREHAAPPRTKPPGKQKGARLSRREQSAGAPAPSRDGLARKSGSGRKKGRPFFRSPGRRKALKGEPQECRKLKEASRG